MTEPTCDSAAEAEARRAMVELEEIAARTASEEDEQ